MMLLLAPQLLLIAVCLGSAESKLDPINIINGLVLGKLNGAVRASAAMRATSLCRACAAHTLVCTGLGSHPHRTTHMVTTRCSWSYRCVARTVRTEPGRWASGSCVCGHAVRSARVLMH